jgi:hypothetical protein
MMTFPFAFCRAAVGQFTVWNIDDDHVAIAILAKCSTMTIERIRVAMIYRNNIHFVIRKCHAISINTNLLLMIVFVFSMGSSSNV